MQGVTGSYAINGTKLSLQPTDGKWEDKGILGIDGNGRARYPAVTEFTLSWGLISTSDFAQLNNFYLSVENTGTVVVDLPKWGDSSYTYYSYSGTHLSRLTAGKYFSEHIQDVQLVVTNIRVG